MSYKSATIGLATVLAATYVALLLVALLVVTPQLRATKTLSQAVQHAAKNDAMCSSVNCEFAPNTAVRAPDSAAVSAAAGNYFVPAAQFAAQAVAVLEDASLKHVDPVALPDTTMLGLFSGVREPVTKRMVNMAWVLRPDSQKDQLWLSFRGTQTKAEWEIDWDMELVPWSDQLPHVHVHRGFYFAALELLPPILQLLRSAATPQTQIFICGHSLGASLALLTTMVLAQQGFSNLHTYVFAPPRVGNSAFVAALLATRGASVAALHAIANVADIIPQLPLSVQPNLSLPSSPLLYAQLPLLMFQDNWGSWVHNHIMPVYIANLSNVAPVNTKLNACISQT